MGDGGCPGGCKEAIKSSLHSPFQESLLNYSPAFGAPAAFEDRGPPSGILRFPRQVFRMSLVGAAAGQAPPSLPAVGSARAADRNEGPMKGLGNHWKRTTITTR